MIVLAVERPAPGAVERERDFVGMKVGHSAPPWYALGRGLGRSSRPPWAERRPVEWPCHDMRHVVPAEQPRKDALPAPTANAADVPLGCRI